MTRTLDAAVLTACAGDMAIPLRDASDAGRVGGKAHHLARMMRIGAFVPDGFVLPTDLFDAHVAPIADAIDVLVARVTDADNHARPAMARAVSAEIRSLVRHIDLSDAIRRTIASRTPPMLTTGPIVVRSSAVGEDSARESYAGQLDSFLGLTSIEDIEYALIACWASCWSERALTYRAGRDLVARGMGVVIQQQVHARAAGVMFTRTTDDEILVEYASGLGNALVSGEISPGRFLLSRDGDRAVTLTEGEHDDALADGLVMSPQVLAQLADAAESLEQELGGPQDVEWAVDERGVVFLVQSRPITAPITVRRAGSDGRPVRWSNANVNENFPAPLSPFLYSIATAGYAHYFRNLAIAFGLSRRRIAAMDDALARIIGVHGARIYYNLTNVHTVLRHAPFGSWLVGAFNRFVGSTGDESTELPVAESRSRELGALIHVAITTTRAYRSLGARVAEFENTVDDFATRAHPDRLPSLGLRELRLLLGEFMEIRRYRWTNAGLADAAAMVSYALLHRLVDRAYDGNPPGALHNTMLQAIPELVSSEPVHQLWALSRLVRDDPALTELFADDARSIVRRLRRDKTFAPFRARFDAYLDAWGFRCSAELMLTLPSYQEQPEPLIETIRAYAMLGGESPEESLARQTADRDAQVRALLDHVRGRPLSPWMPVLSLGFALGAALRWTQASIGYRERARLKQALLYSRCRRLALAIGHQLVLGDLIADQSDVFWLTVSEVDEVASGNAMFPHDLREMIAVRVRAHARLSAMNPPDSLILPEGSYLPLDYMPLVPSSPSPAAAGALRGTGACGGRAHGRATVLRDVSEAARLQEGDILVTRQTDPGWAPVFFLIKGLVIERGGMLSHGAIVAREFGIPCVVGVRDATQRIADGATIAVDADRGEVHVLS